MAVTLVYYKNLLPMIVVDLWCEFNHSGTSALFKFNDSIYGQRCQDISKISDLMEV